MSSIKKLAIRGTIWTIASYGMGQILRFGSNIVLTHLLFPELFGLMSLVYVFIGGLHLFSDIGVGTSIVQNRRGDDPKFLDTAWTLTIVRGLGLWLCCIIIAWPISQFYKEPQLLWLLPIVGLNTAIAGFNSTALFTLSRHLSVKQLAIFELGGQVVSIAVMLIWALFDKSIWALVVGGIASSLFQLIWSHKLNPGKPNRFAWDKEVIEELVSFGKWIFVSTALTFLATQSDRLVLGKLLSFELLGVYGVAYTLADIPKQLTLAVGGKVIFPSYAKFSKLPYAEFRRKIQQLRFPVLLAGAAGLAALIAFGDMAVSHLYDSRYAAAAWMVPVLALGLWPVILNTTLDTALYAVGNPKFITLGCFVSFVFLVGGIWFGYQFFGIPGAVIAVPFSNVPPYFIITYGLWRERLACLGQDIVTTAIFLAILAVLIGVRTLAGFPLPHP
jgi:O-antigen/teichoic acid export membrane protein